MTKEDIFWLANFDGFTGVYDLDPHTINSIAAWMHIYKYGEELWIDIMSIDFDIRDFTIWVRLRSQDDIPALKSHLGQKSGINIRSRGRNRCEVEVSNPPVSTQDFAKFREWRALLPWETEMRTRVTFPTRDARDRFERAHTLWQAAQ